MASLGHVGELATTELRDRIDRLGSAVDDDTTEFAEVVDLANGVSELADMIGELYREVERTLAEGLQGGTASVQDEGQRQEQPHENGSPADDVTKEELLERAREANVHGRSSMSKEELAQAVEAEESLTKDELLERARVAGVEGRSAMTKEELRQALRDAGT